jgi:bifunctional ADP-heptose synthase (sugar kinase/adenylyltransferase)
MILHNDEFLHVAAQPRHIVDVSGAGDTVLSVAALSVALKQDATTIASISNIAGGLVCEEVGVVPIDKEKLLLESKRIICHE